MPYPPPVDQGHAVTKIQEVRSGGCLSGGQVTATPIATSFGVDATATEFRL